MSGCNQNCNQGRKCNCAGQPTSHDPWDKYIRWVLLFAALYFLGHITYALADQSIVQTPDGQIHTCIVNKGWVTCL